MNALRRFSAEALASCFFLTYPLARWAGKTKSGHTGAGFIGTLAGLCTVHWLPQNPRALGFFLAGALFVSVAVSDAAEEILGRKDDQRIVIDEWMGYLASVAFLPRTPALLLVGFVLFRLIDTFKPLGINTFAQLPGGWGVVMDDVAGGLVVNAVLRVLPLS